MKHKTNGFICGPSLYEYKGWFFEIHSYCGPWPLRKDGELRERAGKKFWAMIDEFNNLSDKEIYSAGGIGGCLPI